MAPQRRPLGSKRAASPPGARSVRVSSVTARVSGSGQTVPSASRRRRGRSGSRPSRGSRSGGWRRPWRSARGPRSRGRRGREREDEQPARAGRRPPREWRFGPRGCRRGGERGSRCHDPPCLLGSSMEAVSGASVEPALGLGTPAPAAGTRVFPRGAHGSCKARSRCSGIPASWSGLTGTAWLAEVGPDVLSGPGHERVHLDETEALVGLDDAGARAVEGLVAADGRDPGVEAGKSRAKRLHLAELRSSGPGRAPRAGRHGPAPAPRRSARGARRG